jgi:hypothetical protein
MLFQPPHDLATTEEPLRSDEFTAMEMELCKKAIEQGICRYENRFAKPKDIPGHRVRDATNIRSLLVRGHETTDDLLLAVDTHLATLKTGWIVWGVELIATHRSQFKADVEDSTVLFRHARELSQGYRLASLRLADGTPKSEPLFIPLDDDSDDDFSALSTATDDQSLRLNEFRERAQRQHALNSYCHFSGNFTRKELLINAKKVMEGEVTLEATSAPEHYFPNSFS